MLWLVKVNGDFSHFLMCQEVIHDCAQYVMRNAGSVAVRLVKKFNKLCFPDDTLNGSSEGDL